MMNGLRRTAFGLLAAAGLASAAMGDTQCSDNMCVSANVNGNSTVTYVLQSTGKAELGWMAIGFGTKMADSAIVILWPNDDMSVTVSQRTAPSEVMPTLDANPARVATFAEEDSNPWDCMNPKLAFTIPANSDTTQNLIWAFANSTVDDSSSNATIMGHIAMGTWTFNLQGNAASLNPVDMLTQSVASGPADGSTPTATSTSPSQTGAATSLKAAGKTALLGGALSLTVFGLLF